MNYSFTKMYGKDLEDEICQHILEIYGELPGKVFYTSEGAYKHVSLAGKNIYNPIEPLGEDMFTRYLNTLEEGYYYENN